MEELAFKEGERREVYSQYKSRISCLGNLKPWMTVGAIYNIKMNRLILATAGTAGSLSRLMQMNQIAVSLKAIERA